MKDLKERATIYLCNDRIFETYEDAAIDCAERGIWGSDCKDHIEELPYIGRTYADGAKEKAREILNECKEKWLIDGIYISIRVLEGFCQLEQPQETEGEK